MYWESIIWFLTWPVLIVISYQLIKFAVLKYKDDLEKVD